MLKNITIGILLLALIIGGTLWYRHYQNLMNAEPTKTFVAPAATRQATPTEHGHWHGDEWHAEPHPEPEPDPGPELLDIVLPKLTDVAPGEIRYYDAAKTKPIHWMNYGGIVPDENTPRPYKHLTDEEAHTMDRSGLTPEQQVLLENELYFREPLAREILEINQRTWKRLEEMDRRAEQENARRIQNYEQRQKERDR